MPEITPCELLRNAHGFGMRMPGIVKPRLVIEPNRVRDEHIAFPLTNRIAKPGRIRYFGKPTSIRKDLAIVVELFVENEDHAGSLGDLERAAPNHHRVGYSVWQATPRGPVFRKIVLAFLVKCGRPRLERRPTRFISSEIAQKPAVRSTPNPGQVGLPIAGFRRRCSEIGLTVGVSRRSGQRKIQPLRGTNAAQQEQSRYSKHQGTEFSFHFDPPALRLEQT